MERVRIGVIGAGYWGPHLVRNVSEIPGARLAGVADLAAERLRALRARYPQAILTQDYRDLLGDPTDAVIVATPVRTHHRIARDALRAGKHVLIEKPLTRTAAEALGLIRLAERQGLALMAGHTFEYNPAVLALRDLIRRGDIGQVLYVDAARLNLGQFRHDVNVLWDLAPHDISIMNLILGAEPTHVSARGSSCVHPYMHDVAYLELRYPGDILGHIHVSWLEPAKVRRVTVVGDEKMVVYNDVAPEEKLRVYDKGVVKTTSSGDFADFQLTYHFGGVSIPAVPGGEPLKLEIAHFVEAILQGTTPRSDGWSGLRVTQALEAADKSLNNGGTRKKIRSAGELEVIEGAKPLGPAGSETPLLREASA
ncbi:MAG: Gfo/Idh/MocA family oxidoreductase [Chloroflexi bacterium]|nr:Gfo/Idh/MocA family oxidoreductase [Chloroflexota bacterium]